ncbi:hypothetical protein SAMN05444157_1745 [Frankineae bacterium MT45]|nr:hypothetical protein SAMN05444157_1745 [Frankineae bacterium MT45]
MSDQPANSYQRWPEPARAICVALDDAVSAARAAEPADFAQARIDLLKLDREQLNALVGAVTRDLLERFNPDGLDAEGVEAAVRGCAAAAAGWYPTLNAETLLWALVGALGMADAEERDDTSYEEQLAHSLLLMSSLLGDAARADASVTTAGVLAAALGEIRRAETMEMP